MDLNDLLATLNAGATIDGDSPLHIVMHEASQEARRITAQTRAAS
jgi:hypothetical protein